MCMSIAKNELPEGAFTELWYMEDSEDDFRFWSMIENLKNTYGGFGVIGLTNENVDKLGLEVL